MAVQSLAPLDGLSPAEVTQIVVFAVQSALAVETGTTEDGSRYASLHYSASNGMNDSADTWTVSREKGRVVAFHEHRGLLPRRKAVSELLLDLAFMLPANESGASDQRFGS